MNIQDATETLSVLKGFAVEAGIYESWFICFGTLLGAIRPTRRKTGKDVSYVTGIMQHDSDMDIGVLSDRITEEQEQKYYDLVHRSPLVETRGQNAAHTQRRSDTNRLCWFTLRGKEPPEGTKVCHWFWLPWNNRYWHTKGKKWVTQEKFDRQRFPYLDSDEAMMLGVPQKHLEKLVEVEFEGIRVNIPLRAGSCCDLWYPGWMTVKEHGSSLKLIVARVPRWGSLNTWKILPNERR